MRASTRHGMRCPLLPTLLSLVLSMAIGMGPAVPSFAAAAPARAAPPDLDLLEYLGRLEGSDGNWVGPEDMAPVADDARTGSGAGADANRRQAQVESAARMPAATPTGEQRHAK